MKKYLLLIEVLGKTIIQETNHAREVAQWAKEYQESSETSSFKVFEKNGLAYECVVNEHKRKIGF